MENIGTSKVKIKINQTLKKIQNYRNNWIQHVRRMDRDRLPNLIANINQVENEAKDKTLKDFLTVKRTRTGHKA
jgi:hypothetical protein